MFSTKGVSESGGKYISYGIRNVKFTSITAQESEGGSTPSIFINFEEVGTGKTLSSRFPFSEKSTQISLRKIKHMLTKIVDETTADGIFASTLTEYAAAISKYLVNNTLRIKFNGEEVQGKEGKNNWFKAVVNFPPFAEALSVNPTELKFDSVADVKRLAFASSTPTHVGAAKDDSLPF